MSDARTSRSAPAALEEAPETLVTPPARGALEGAEGRPAPGGARAAGPPGRLLGLSLLVFLASAAVGFALVWALLG